MSVAPGPSASRGQVILQPSYFTSSLYVEPLREDITALIKTFHGQYAQTQPTEPFTLFKNIWRSEWMWMHFKVFDSRTRETFLAVTLRLFLERIVVTEAPLNRVVALFGLYTFFYTQPSGSAPPIHSIGHISIPLDHYSSLVTLPSALTTVDVLPLQPAATYILSTLLEAEVFHILPSSELGPLNPREIPRELFIHDDTPSPEAPKKKGRPTKREKVKRAKDALGNLDSWMEKNTYPAETPPPGYASMPKSAPETAHTLMLRPPQTTLLQYQIRKSHLLNSIDPHPYHTSTAANGHMALEKANHHVLERLVKMDEQVGDNVVVRSGGGNETGIERVRRAVGELDDAGHRRRGGLLGLIEGAGIS